MSHQKSVTLVCTAANLIAANLAIQYSPVSLSNATFADRGPTNITVPLSATGEAPATHYGAHTYNDDLLSLLEDVATKAAMFPMIDFDAIENPNGSTVGFHAHIAALGLQRVFPPEE
jgi:hypothetical protein